MYTDLVIVLDFQSLYPSIIIGDLSLYISLPLSLLLSPEYLALLVEPEFWMYNDPASL